ncbi:hypothetical protein Pla52o_35110 [Novipirellula galeiformis]|uniref:Uncharacterized protein n=1 Tax=Novipirellula galeiformis TaxID=2528004 RepID=A0A5C6CEL0_9BACT|nr:hypothetical protein [Novipirellula galeiformis]TWU22455.1 hypothetical protein Pla52o_35110 [Novipirellula galeiformis]
MIEAETALLEAVRDTLRTKLKLNESQCDVELDDETVPAISSAKHFSVSSAGLVAGKHHARSGGAIDLLLSVRVVVYHRMGDVPRDRRRSVLLERTRGLNADLTAVMDAIDFRYEPMNLATSNISTLGSREGFLEPLKFDSADTKPQPVFKDPYDAASSTAKGDPTLAIRRGVKFSGARFVMTRRQQA